MDKTRIENAIREILLAIGEDPHRPGLIETPERISRMLSEILQPDDYRITTFPNDKNYDQFIICKDILFHSICEHHMLPFFGHITIGYLPNDRLIGLSKLVRLVQYRAARLQIQEQMTQEIANTLDSTLQPQGVGVIIEAEHHCISARGAKMPGHKTITSAMRGELLNNATARAEFLALCDI